MKQKKVAQLKIRVFCNMCKKPMPIEKLKELPTPRICFSCKQVIERRAKASKAKNIRYIFNKKQPKITYCPECRRKLIDSSDIIKIHYSICHKTKPLKNETQNKLASKTKVHRRVKAKGTSSIWAVSGGLPSLGKRR